MPVGMKLYRFPYSPYARKVQMLLDLAGLKYELIEVDYVDRHELAEVSGGYVYVPVLVTDAGHAITESRNICQHILQGSVGERLVPAPFQGPIWAYSDFTDGALEDVLFRVASPATRDAWPTAFARGLYVLIKERKFGVGCVDAWERDRATLIQKARVLLAPTLQTLAAQRFLFGDRPTLADAALYGQCAMLEAGSASLLEAVAPELVGYARRLEAAAGIA
jgi:glutathione S-transferase